MSNERERERAAEVTERPRDRRPGISIKKALSLAITMFAGVLIGVNSVDRGRAEGGFPVQTQEQSRFRKFDAQINDNSARMMEEGKNTFRFETFGDEAFWGDALRLHQAIEGDKFGGVGAGLSLQAAIDLVGAILHDFASCSRHSR